MSEFLAVARPAVPRPDARRRTRPTPTSGAPPTRPRRSRSCRRGWRSSRRSWASPTGTRPSTIATEDVTIRFEDGWPVALNGRELADQVELVRRGQRDRRPPRPRHERPDREPHHRGQEPRHLRGARAGAAAHRLRAPGHGDPQRGHDRELPHDGPPPRPAALRGPLVRPAEPDAARAAAALGRRRRSPAR